MIGLTKLKTPVIIESRISTVSHSAKGMEMVSAPPPKSGNSSAARGPQREYRYPMKGFDTAPAAK